MIGVADSPTHRFIDRCLPIPPRTSIGGNGAITAHDLGTVTEGGRELPNTVCHIILAHHPKGENSITSVSTIDLPCTVEQAVAHELDFYADYKKRPDDLERYMIEDVNSHSMIICLCVAPISRRSPEGSFEGVRNPGSI